MAHGRLVTPREFLAATHASTSWVLDMQADLPGSDPLATLFAEELGLLLEVDPQHEQAVLEAYSQAGLQPTSIGSVAADSSISIAVSSEPAISGMSLSPL